MKSETGGFLPIATDDSIRKLLIFRPDNLGDVVLFSGALRPIRETWPHAHITLAVQKSVLNYLELCPYVDSLTVWGNGTDFHYDSWFQGRIDELNRITGGRLCDLTSYAHMVWVWLTALKVRYGDILPSTYDVILFPVRSPNWKHHTFVGSRRARLRVGISGDHSNQAFFVDQVAEKIYTARYNLSRDRLWDHELEVTQDFLRFLGIRVDFAGIQPTTWTNDSDASEARRLCADTEYPRLGISLGASWSGKIFPVDGIIAAISAIADHRLSCCLFGTEKEAYLCADLHEKLSRCPNVPEVVNLSGKTTVRTLIECLRLCDIVLASDAATLHIATAIGKPTVGIRGGGHCSRFYPWGNSKINRVASRLMDCYGCNWTCSTEGVPCVSAIPPTAIAQDLESLLDGLKSQGKRRCAA